MTKIMTIIGEMNTKKVITTYNHIVRFILLSLSYARIVLRRLRKFVLDRLV